VSALAAHPARAAWLVVAAGGVAALQVGKLPPALPALQAELGLTLVQSGFLLSIVQLAGLSLAVFMGLLADGMGLKRSMVRGLCLLALASGLGGFATSVTALLVLRAIEGLGFLLVALPAPALIRRLVPPAQLPGMLGVWGAYMPTGTALALLLGPLFIPVWGWGAWWGLFAAVSLVMALWLLRAVPVDPPSAAASAGQGAWSRLRRTLSAPGPWLVALTFGMYSGQWLAVIGFLPTILAQAGVDHAVVGWGTALVAAANGVGNVAAGRLLGRGWSVRRLLSVGFLTMASMSVLAFAGGLAPLPQLLAVTVFSAVGGLIPATLFSLAVRLAPGAHTVSTTVGWVQQLSAFGQFAGPPLVAWLVGRHGGDWSPTYWFTTACALAGLWLAGALQRRAST